MGTITCTVNEGATITVTSVLSQTMGNTWARFQSPFFNVSGGGTFNLVLTVPHASFRFNTIAPPITWVSPSSQPSWITVPPNTATELTLQIASSTSGTSVFTVLNATTDGQSITITVNSAGGTGGAGGPINAYVGDDQSTQIGPLPAGAQAGGVNLFFGLNDVANGISLQQGASVEFFSCVWNQGEPSNMTMSEISSQISISVNNPNSADPPVQTQFSLLTNGGLIDPTIVTNPDENGP